MNALKNEGGFTLLEIIISLAIILILVLAFSGGIMNAFRTESRVDQRLEAIRITDSIIESLRVNKDLWKDIEKWEDDKHIGMWNDVDDEIDYTIGIDNTSDIILECYPYEDSDNLFLFQIEWDDRNYNAEILLAGEE